MFVLLSFSMSMLLLWRWYSPHLLTSVADIISTVEFDQTGNYLATGDKGGRVVLFERNETVSADKCLARLARLFISSLTCAEKNMRVQVPY